MLSNTRGAAVIAGSITTATFRGPPIVACSADYAATTQASYWANLLGLATLLDVPALHVDYAHDGGLAPLLAALASLQRFYSPGTSEPWAHSSGGALQVIPVCGPLFFFDRAPLMSGEPDFTAAGTGAHLAGKIAEASLNFRRNHVYNHATSGVWTVAGEDLDRVQRPPIHFFSADKYASPSWWSETLPSWWKVGVPSSTAPVPFEFVYKNGLLKLADQENAFPGITRHFLPTLVASDFFRLFYLAHN